MKFIGLEVFSVLGIFLLISGNLIQNGQAQSLISGKVTRIVDGDTIEVIVSDTGAVEKVRIACIDAPEREQGSYYIQSKQRLEQLIPAGTSIFLKDTQTRSYGRIVAEVLVANRSIGVQMVREGHAIVYCRHLDSCPTSRKNLINAEAAAMKAKLGVWQASLDWTQISKHPCRG